MRRDVGQHEQILEPDAVTPEPRRERAKEDGGTDDASFVFGNDRVRDRVGPEEMTPELVTLEHNFAGRAFIGRERVHKLDERIEVGGRRVAYQRLTNGVATTWAGTCSPRMSTVTSVPGSMPGGKNASAIP